MIRHFRRHRYDVVLSTTPKAILLGSIAAWISRQRHRVVFFQGRVYENDTGLRRRIFAALDRLAIRLSTRSLFVSRSLLAAYVDEGLIPSGKGEVIGPGSVGGVDIDIFSPDRFTAADRDALKHALGIEKHHVVAMSVGRIRHDKGLMELTALASRFADREITFVVVGAVEQGYETDAAALFAMANVQHVPFTTDIARHFAIADVHLFMTHREGFGNVAIEAAGCGVPTIAFDVIGVKDSVSDGVSGIRLPLSDVATVEAAIASLMRDREAFRSRFAGVRSWAETTYSRDRVWSAYTDFLTSFRASIADAGQRAL
jgi:glycosyltransferase involved in cell wall biosynthesis